VLITACGQLTRPRFPELPGREVFAGRQFHSARWDHDFALVGKRVAVIGNGASAIQIVPQIAPVVAKLHVFQRSANWLVPRKDGPYSKREQWIFRHVLWVERLRRWAIYAQLDLAFAGFRQGSWIGRIAEYIATRHLNRQVSDPRLRAMLRPDYPMGCKRVLIADDYYPALQRANVELVTTPLQCLTRDSILTADGTARPIDAVIYATGFEATQFLAPMEIVGAEGVPLERRWRQGAEAYYGMAVPGYPNFFVMYGPNTNLGHNSIVFMIECQANYIRRCLMLLLNGGIAELEVKAEAMARFEAGVQKDLEHTVWTAACRNWYKTASGRIVTNWSGFTAQYWWRTLRPRFADFRTLPEAPAPRST
jgi:cation diffusion facilitator CzcD-associated flavoprotein CzcO